jgi:acetylornithine aminotransferase
MDILTFESEHFFQTYKRLPLKVDHAEGMYIYTEDGTRYLDMFAGIAVNALGHNHSGVIGAIEEQSRKYLHLSNYFIQSPQLTLARLLLNTTGFKRIFFSNSGTEATEGAIKIARRFGSTSGKKEILGFSNGFHGRTMGALSIMDRPSYREHFGPFLTNCRVVPFNDPLALKKTVDTQTLAVVIEFIQGEGGVRPASIELVRTIEALRSEFGFLLIADEIQTGLGRTGKLFAFEHFNCRPDIVLVAKALGGGLPLGAILGNDRVAALLHTGSHGSTFGGNPVACAAGAVVLKELLDGGLLSHVESIGRFLLAALHRVQRGHRSLVTEIRGSGLMLGMELSVPAESIAAMLREKRVLVNVTDKTVLRIVPPLIIQEQHALEFITALDEVLTAVERIGISTVGIETK